MRVKKGEKKRGRNVRKRVKKRAEDEMDTVRKVGRHPNKRRRGGWNKRKEKRQEKIFWSRTLKKDRFGLKVQLCRKTFKQKKRKEGEAIFEQEKKEIQEKRGMFVQTKWRSCEIMGGRKDKGWTSGSEKKEKTITKKKKWGQGGGLPNKGSARPKQALVSQKQQKIYLYNAGGKEKGVSASITSPHCRIHKVVKGGKNKEGDFQKKRTNGSNVYGTTQGCGGTKSKKITKQRNCVLREKNGTGDSLVSGRVPSCEKKGCLPKKQKKKKE